MRQIGLWLDRSALEARLRGRTRSRQSPKGALRLVLQGLVAALPFACARTDLRQASDDPFQPGDRLLRGFQPVERFLIMHGVDEPRLPVLAYADARPRRLDPAAADATPRFDDQSRRIRSRLLLPDVPSRSLRFLATRKRWRCKPSDPAPPRRHEVAALPFHLAEAGRRRLTPGRRARRHWTRAERAGDGRPR